MKSKVKFKFKRVSILKQLFCKHEWYMDNQIRVIRCSKCHKMERIIDYKNLY